jgi:Gametolysin peptidase M11
LKLSNVIVTEDVVHLLSDSSIVIHQNSSEHRQLAPTTGTLSILSIYVTSVFGEAPTSTVDDIKNGILGTGPANTPHNPLSQFRNCSYGALNIQPGGLGNNVNGGVLQVQVNRRLDSTCDTSVGTCMTEIRAATDALLGRSYLDYQLIMWCLPPGVLSSGSPWGGFAFFGGKQSFYRSRVCKLMSIVAHELGHSLGKKRSRFIVYMIVPYTPVRVALILQLGFGHDNDIVQGPLTDFSGIMGYGVSVVGGPRTCLNGHKYAQSGWMSGTTTTVDLSVGAFLGRIVAFVDRGLMGANTSGDSTLLRIPLATGADVYALYKRKKGFNDGTRQGGDLVTLTQTDVTDTSESNRLAMLDALQQYTIPGTSIVVRVCLKGAVGSMDYVSVSVFDTSRAQATRC